MKKYNEEIVKKYINGEEIEGYSLEELENDKGFMMKVISLSKDKKLYNLCSEKLLQDYEFIKYLILTFKDDLKFVSKVADNYLATNHDEESVLELCIIMCDITKRDKYSYPQYPLKLNVMVRAKKFTYLVKFSKELNVSSYFLLSTARFSNNKIITDFYADKCLHEIYKENLETLKSLLMSKTVDNLSKDDLINFIINYAKLFDIGLAGYLNNNHNLLEWYVDDLQKKISIWKKSTEENMYEKIDNLVRIERENGLFSDIWEDVLYYAYKETGILEVMNRHGYLDYPNREKMEEFLFDLSDDEFENTLIEEQEDAANERDYNLPKYSPVPEDEFYKILKSDEDDVKCFQRMIDTVNTILRANGKGRKRKKD